MYAPSKALVELREEWDSKIERFKRLQDEYMLAVKQLATLNVSLYNQCKEEGINCDLFMSFKKTKEII